MYTSGPHGFIFKPPIATRRHYGRDIVVAQWQYQTLIHRVATVYSWPLNHPVYTTRGYGKDPSYVGDFIFFLNGARDVEFHFDTGIRTEAVLRDYYRLTQSIIIKYILSIIID